MFSPNTLNLMPTAALGSITDALTAQASQLASAVTAEAGRAARGAGTAVTDTFSQGTTVQVKTNTQAGIEKSGLGAGPQATADIAQTLNDGGVEPFVAGTVAPGTVVDSASISQMGAEIGAQLTPTLPNPTTILMAQLDTAASVAKVALLQGLLNAVMGGLDQTKDVLAKRASGELPNPVLNVSQVDDALNNIINDLEQAGLSPEQLAALRAQLEAAANQNLDRFEKYVINNISIPYAENRAALDIIKARLLGAQEDDEEQPIFDTVFGPPVSTDGKFILSEDGIYYDSRTGSIPYITARQIDSMSWQLRYESNRGGRGQEFTQDNTLRFADTILSDEYENETSKVLDFYKYDDVLINIENDRDLQVRDVKTKVEDLIASGYDADSAVVKNYEESYAAVAHTYDRKIKKRKKQLQVAALFGPFGVTSPGDPRGEGLFYREYTKQAPLIEALCGSDQKVERLSYLEDNQTSAIEFIPRIPVNDFSYLKDIGLVPELESQKKSMLHSSDLDDTTAPVAPVFLEQGPGAKYEAIPELSITPYGTANWLNTSGDTTDMSGPASSLVLGTVPYLRTLDDDIVTDSLVVCYNFLEADAPTTPDMDHFGVRNYVQNGRPLNAKMVGAASSIFVSGISIPYFTGSLYRPGDKYGFRYDHLPKGSYVRLPNNYRNNLPYPASQPIDELMYSNEGWSMDFWVYAPNLYDGMTVDHRYKLVAANENCGDPVTKSITSTMFTTAALEPGKELPGGRFRTRGMMIGFRDKGEPGTDVSAGLEFVVLPTVAQNDPKWGKSVAIAEAVSGEGQDSSCRRELGFKVPASATTESGYSIADASSAFTQYTITCDPPTDTISLHVNGEFLLSANTSTSFDKKPGVPLQIPSRIGEGHHHEQRGAFGEKLYDGDLPQTPVFTPWILGGGFTDGIAESPQSVLDTTLPGFLGTNTNTSYFIQGVSDHSGGPVGQHSDLTIGSEIAGLGGYTRGGSNYLLARSGLDGHIGSFKMYAKPLSKLEVEKNYKAQSPFFNGIERPKHLL